MTKFYTNSEIDTAVVGKVNADDLGSMAYVDDAPSDGKEYLRKDGAWSEPSSADTAVWGNITGTLSDQTDLQNALNAKQDTLTDSGWLEATPEQTSGVNRYSGKIYYRKIGSIVYINAYSITLADALSGARNLTLATLPSGYRPDKTSAAMAWTSATTIVRTLPLAINTSGNVVIYTNPNDGLTTSDAIRFSGSFPT